MSKFASLSICLLALLLPHGLVAAPSLSDYLPAGPSYDSAIPTPASVLGFEVGEWHVRPDQLVRYMETVAASSDRLRLEVQGRTHEGRPQVLLIAASPANHARMDEILAARSRLLRGDEEPSEARIAAQPSIVLLGYSIHGDEASGSNASLLTAYYLAAARGPEIDALLESTIVLVDPSLNPDGLGRFAHWANTHRGLTPLDDPQHWEHVQGWPSGRTNHYFFDLNRDWLLLQQPESRHRVATFHRFLPNLLGDYHEMGTNSTYFFQPGVPSRTNPRTPARNVELTQEIARYHAAALDADGRRYYTQETFDDFYPGKGSTYPDLNGSVGVLFEQASARGHLNRNSDGPLPFSFGIENQFRTSLSMLKAAREKREELLRYQVDFFRSALRLAGQDATGAYVFSTPGDPARSWELVRLLRQHQIEVRRLSKDLERNGHTFQVAESFAVPTRQRQYRLIKELFEPRTEFPDSTFYDVSTWTMPLAFGARSTTLASSEIRSRLGEAVGETSFPQGKAPAEGEAYGFLFDWSHHYAPRALNRLLSAGALARVATRPFTSRVGGEERRFDYGTIFLPTGGQQLPTERLRELFEEIARLDGVTAYPVSSGLSAAGPDLGSPGMRPLESVRPLLVVGRQVSTYAAGEIWHLLDHRFQVPVSLVEGDRLPRLDLDEYTHILLPDGRYSWEEDMVERLRRWVRGGGVVVALESAASWSTRHLLGQEGSNGESSRSESEAPGEPAASSRGRYADYEQERAKELLSGAIFEVEIDPTHPMAFGMGLQRLPVFRSSTLRLTPSVDPFENVALYTANPRLSGYASERNIQRLAGSGAVLASRLGQGSVIRIADDPAFRGFWLGTERWVLNALFFGPVLKNTSPPLAWD